MKVSELKNILNRFNPETEVGFAYDFGDYWGTTVVAGINNADLMPVKYSAYHRMNKLVNDDNDDDAGDETKLMLIIE